MAEAIGAFGLSMHFMKCSLLRATARLLLKENQLHA